LVTAVQSGRDDVTEALLTCGATPTSNALAKALESCSASSAKLLIARLAPEKLKEKHGGYSMLQVALNGLGSKNRKDAPQMEEVVDLLWDANFVSWDEKDRDGNTFLHLLCAACARRHVKKLAKGLGYRELTVKNRQDMMPSQVARTCLAGTPPWEAASVGLAHEHSGFPMNYAIVADIAIKCGDATSMFDAIEAMFVNNLVDSSGRCPYPNMEVVTELLQKMAQLMQKQMADAMATGDPDKIETALEQAKYANVYLEKVEEKAAMTIVILRIEDALKSQEPAKIQSALMTLQQHDSALKKSAHWDSQAVSALEQSAIKALKDIHKKNAERLVQEQLEGAIDTKDLRRLIVALREAEKKNFTHLPAYSNGKRALAGIVDEDLRLAAKTEDETTLKTAIDRAANTFRHNGIDETDTYKWAQKQLQELPLTRMRSDFQKGLGSRNDGQILQTLKMAKAKKLRHETERRVQQIAGSLPRGEGLAERVAG
jgi:hypothetical protein